MQTIILTIDHNSGLVTAYDAVKAKDPIIGVRVTDIITPNVPADLQIATVADAINKAIVMSGYDDDAAASAIESNLAAIGSYVRGLVRKAHDCVKDDICE